MVCRLPVTVSCPTVFHHNIGAKPFSKLPYDYLKSNGFDLSQRMLIVKCPNDQRGTIQKESKPTWSHVLENSKKMEPARKAAEVTTLCWETSED